MQKLIKDIPIHVTIFATFATIFSMVVGIVIWYNYSQNNKAALESAQQIIQHVSLKVEERFERIFKPLYTHAELSSEVIHLSYPPSVHLHPAINYLIKTLDAYPQLERVFMAYDNGEFFSVQLAGQISQKSFPQNTHYIIQQVSDIHGKTVLINKYLNKHRFLIGHDIQKEHSHTHQDKSWYTDSMLSKSAHYSMPHVMEFSHEIGVTLARRFEGDLQGVFGMDIPLRQLNLFLTQQKLDSDTHLAILNSDGSLLSSSDSPVSDTVSSSQSLPLEGLDNPVLKQIYREHIYRHTDVSSRQTFIMQVDHEEYIVTISSLAKELQFEKKIILAVPLRYFTGTIKDSGIQSALFALLMCLIALPLILYFARYIARPLRLLAQKASQIRQQDMKDSIIVDSQITEIKKLASVLDLTKRMEILLDNADQGFLTINQNLLVNDECSDSCHRIFQTNISGLSIASLLFPTSQKEKSTYETNLLSVMKEEDSFKRDMILTLLPRSLQLDETFLEVEYRFINHTMLMMIITDITEQIQMHNKIEKERNNLKMIINAVNQQEDFLKVVHDFKAFANHGIAELILQSNDSKALLENAYAQVHTHKGSLNQYSVSGTAAKLHGIEDTLRKMTPEEENLKETLQALLDSESLLECIDQDMLIIVRVLGEEFFQQNEQIGINRDQLNKIADSLINLYTSESNMILLNEESLSILEDIQSLTKIPLQTLLEPIVTKLGATASKLEKKLNPVSIEGGEDILMDEQKSDEWIRSLVHIFNNAIDHGIESPNQRTQRNKPPEGTITCTLSSADGYIFLEISDDGQGIDPMPILESAVTNQIISEDEALNMSDEEAYNLIFEQRVSSKEKATSISGRGVGMASVKIETEKLGGTIKIRTVPGKGTTFHLVIPEESLL